MEIKLKERWTLNRVFQAMQNSGKPYTRITGMTPGNVSGMPIEPIAYEQAIAYLAHKAETESKRAQALVGVHFLSLR